MSVSAQDLLGWIQRYAEVIAENKAYLVDLDSAIGDADHGENLDRGMRAAVAQLAESTPETPSDVLKTVATQLISKVGGAAGPLYGSAFLRASAVVVGKPELEPADLFTALRAGLGGVIARGKAELGDKTMVDAWTPAVEAGEAALADGKDLAAALSAAADAAEEGMRATVPLVARKGRASYLGERSAGHQDPGATSTAYLFRTLADRVA
jgi:phosphoenolpyruvate---glycerone phosphotransferase subunit DhaL